VYVSAGMSESKTVICGAHGETPATYMCRHVAHGSACGFHASAEDPSDRWPDAWCDLCDEAFQAAGGEWNEASEASLDAKLLCTHCYADAQARNVRVPHLVRGASTRLTAAEQDALLHHAVHDQQAIQAAADDRWGFIRMARWDYKPETRTLTLSDPDKPTVIANVRHVGSYSTKSESFQWAWATYEPGAAEVEDISRLRVFGEVRGITRLTTPNWPADETDGWEMASLAGYILGAEGVYRPPFDHLRWFMLLSNLRHAS
jgi:hypothetical protein